MVNSKSVVGFKPGDSGVVIGYQVAPGQWSASLLDDTFILVSMGNTSTPIHFPLKTRL